jgi:ketosteroid isomerase-like protein
MSQENVELVQRTYEAFNRGDFETMVADVRPDAEYIASGAIPGVAGVYLGPNGYKRFASWLSDQFDGARTVVRECIDAGDQVAVCVTIRGRGKQSGVETSWNVWQVWTLRDGAILRSQGFVSREEALEAAGVPAKPSGCRRSPTLDGL